MKNYSFYFFRKEKKIYFQNLIFFLITIFFSICFWVYTDIGSTIYPKYIFAGEYAERNDMSSYFLLYNKNLDFFDIAKEKGSFYLLVTFFLKKLGISFESFLFFIVLIFYATFISFFYTITSEKNLVIYLFLCIFLSFWMQSYVGVILRQGVAFIFFFYFYFFKHSLSFKNKFLILLFASNIHIVMIFFLPLLLFDDFFVKKIQLAEYFFLMAFVLYSFNFVLYLSELVVYLLNFFEIYIKQINLKVSGGYKVGFSINKALAICTPFVMVKLTRFLKKSTNILQDKIYLYFIYCSILGMSCGGLAYHDRIMSLGWIVSPILICSTIRPLLAFFLQKSKDLINKFS